MSEAVVGELVEALGSGYGVHWTWEFESIPLTSKSSTNVNFYTKSFQILIPQLTVKSTVEVNLGVLQRKKYLRMNRNFWRRYMRLNLDYWKVDGLFKINNQFLNQVLFPRMLWMWGTCCIGVINMNWRLVLLIIFILEGIYYLTNRFLFNRTFKEIKFWEWIIVIMIIPLIFGYLYVNQGTWYLMMKKDIKTY